MLAGVILGDRFHFKVIGFISIKCANFGIVESYDIGFQIDQGVRINKKGFRRSAMIEATDMMEFPGHDFSIIYIQSLQLIL